MPTNDRLAQISSQNSWCFTAEPNCDCREKGNHTHLELELEMEIHSAHPFFGKPLVLIAHALGSDDILCQHADDPVRYSIIHLTMSGRKEIFDCPTIDDDVRVENDPIV